MTRLVNRPLVSGLLLGIALLALSPRSLAQEGGKLVETTVGTRVYTEGLRGVDFSGLNEEQKELALKVLNESACDCGCRMTVAQCRVEDQTCPRSPSLARAIVDAIRRGGDEEAAQEAYRAALVAGRPSRPPERPAVHDIAVGDSPARGPASAAVTVVEFSDFQCPFCARALPVVQQVLDLYPEEVRIVFKHLPLPIHPRARDAALAAEAAREQGKFWEMHDLLFRNPASLEREALVGYAGQLGLDTARFEADMDSAGIAARVDRDIAEAARVDANGTPTFYVNGKRLRSYQLNAFRQAIERSLAPSQPSGSPE